MRLLQLTEKLSQDLCRYASQVPIAEQKISAHFLCHKREPANTSQVTNNHQTEEISNQIVQHDLPADQLIQKAILN